MVWFSRDLGGRQRPDGPLHGELLLIEVRVSKERAHERAEVDRGTSGIR
jgi:hypothetical protein